MKPEGFEAFSFFLQSLICGILTLFLIFTFKLTGKQDVTGIYVSADSNAARNSVVTLGENILIENSSTYYSPTLITGALDFVNLTYADGYTYETDGEFSDATAGVAKRSYIRKGTYWKTVPVE